MIHLEKLTARLKQLTKLVEDGWIERESLRYLLSEANPPHWEDKLAKARSNPQLRKQAQQYSAPLIRGLDEALKEAWAQELSQDLPPIGKLS